MLIYFSVGLFMRYFSFEKKIFWTFIFTTFLLGASVIIFGWQLLFINGINMIFLAISYYTGYKTYDLKPFYKFASITILGVFFYTTLFLIRPVFIFKSLDKSILTNIHVNDLISNTKVIDNNGSYKPIDFIKGNVYLIEFYFKNCAPCKIKNPIIMDLKEKINHPNFYIIYIQSGLADDFSTYIETCKEEGSLNRFYDKNDSIANRLKVNGYPTEFIIDKNGFIRYTLNGFSDNIKEVYLAENIFKIKTLLDE